MNELDLQRATTEKAKVCVLLTNKHGSDLNS